MNLRLLLDEDVHLVLASALRKRGHDAVHVGEAGALESGTESNWSSRSRKIVA
jgi:hypothetical protein